LTIFLRTLLNLLLITTATAVIANPRPGEITRRSENRNQQAQLPADFVDVTRASGIHFQLTCGSHDKRYIMDSMCGGVAVIDYDNDGWMDLLLVDGSTLQDLHAGKCHPPHLYRNDHRGGFVDVSAKAGLTHCGWGFGVAAGDYDNDGWEDLYITYLDGAVLYHNNHDGTFSDVTLKSGAGNTGRWGTSAAFGDYDNDGYLDLYVANYVQVDLDHLPAFGGGPFCQYRGIPVSCGPRGMPGSRDSLYHNNGDGSFTDVSEKLNIDSDGYYGLGVLWLDYDRDGCLDLYVANDSSPSLLYHNNCKGSFNEVGAAAGVAYSEDGREQAGMGIDSADYDHDGWPDIIKTNFSDDSNNLFHNERNGEFTDFAAQTGIGPVSIPFLGFGAKFFDYDNDGWPDIFIANGHVNPQVDRHSFGVTYAERPFLFHNFEGRQFTEIGLKSGSAMGRTHVGRGAAIADFRNNGMQDVVMTVLDGSPVLLRNRTVRSGHWLRIKMLGTNSNRDGFGARVEVKAAGVTQVQDVRANSSFESASDPRLHFGLGAAKSVDSITVRWPSGKVDNLTAENCDQEILVQEGKGVEKGNTMFPPNSRTGTGQPYQTLAESSD
jgi:enediyne biosynthesis protein E4